MPSPVFISRPPPGFSLLAVVRGFQLTIVGGYRAIKNPELAKSGYYRKAGEAILWSLAIQLILWIPLIVARGTLIVLYYVTGQYAEGAESSIEGWIGRLKFWREVLNVGPVLISAVRFIRPEMDDLFLKSLQFVDRVYKQKHPESNREFYRALIRYDSEKATTATPVTKPRKRDSILRFIKKTGMRAAQTIAVYSLSGVPVLGKLVLPAVSFYSFNEVVGTAAAICIFSAGLFVPRHWMMVFLSTFWGSRRLVRELLSPYFSRVPFSRVEKEHWFSAREGIMFGFGAGFYLLLRIPFLGVLVYGFAEASAAFLLTKVSDPPPAPSLLHTWTTHQTVWTEKLDNISA
ncbi:hypothetical protein TRVA0_014S02652 [Trichomonascus vanleenenianus]|uniref:uncharacterized protein n=1 Tax=Trichomonascus vanleenenianus TaxID=2268995 RepID=UPI003EC9E8B2